MASQAKGAIPVTPYRSSIPKSSFRPQRGSLFAGHGLTAVGAFYILQKLLWVLVVRHWSHIPVAFHPEARKFC